MSTKTFRIYWRQGYGHPPPKPQTHEQAWFSEDNGFDADARAELDGLYIGETARFGGPTDLCEVVRTK